ncbi:HD domain-containing protein [Aliicoccus persicus]|uniref:3'-5' exoribonuclease n=1 Tax=Aliicoccus persicus TaxID=930138 RepID=A0A662Z5F7_9STAP|nr:HD domain-containing protein [Aliicoccus persicus]SEW19371.1 3'-5' exoribonuclease [Aliicoccus persicus]
MNTIANLKPGDSVNNFFLIKDSKQGVTTQGKPYMSMMLQDKSGEIDTKYWTVTKEDAPKLIAGVVIKVQGDVIDYRGKKQLKILNCRVAESTDNVRASEFVENAPISEQELFDTVMDYVIQIDDVDLSRIVRHLVTKYKEEFLSFPAAKVNHHDFHSGLAYHVTCMLRQGEALVDIYPQVNRALLYSGIILHDIGKVKELSGSIGVQYTREGNLLGHIVIASEEVNDAATELGIDRNSESVLLLKHLILSHHGKLEYGSPKVPMILEAELLHFIDNIDARIMMFDKNLKNVAPGEFSDRVFPLESRQLYQPIVDDYKME